MPWTAAVTSLRLMTVTAPVPATCRTQMPLFSSAAMVPAEWVTETAPVLDQVLVVTPAAIATVASAGLLTTKMPYFLAVMSALLVTVASAPF